MPAMLRRARMILLTLLTVLTPFAQLNHRANTGGAGGCSDQKLKPNWQRIEDHRGENRQATEFKLYYKPLGQRDSPVVNKSEATADTKEIAGVVLDELKKEGKDPAKDRINLSVWAQQDAGKGMTGKPLTRPFGRTVYNDKSDRLEYRP